MYGEIREKIEYLEKILELNNIVILKVKVVETRPLCQYFKVPCMKPKKKFLLNIMDIFGNEEAKRLVEEIPDYFLIPEIACKIICKIYRTSGIILEGMRAGDYEIIHVKGVMERKVVDMIMYSMLMLKFMEKVEDMMDLCEDEIECDNLEELMGKCGHACNSHRVSVKRCWMIC